MVFTLAIKRPKSQHFHGAIRMGFYELILKVNKLIDVGERKVVLAARDYGRGKPRFIINLPTTRNDLWQFLWENKVTIKVYIEIPENELEKALSRKQSKS